MTWNMSRVLVTGGSGLIGVYTMRRLAEKGHRGMRDYITMYRSYLDVTKEAH
jgi:NAD(P)-dependent dehydrogenase (short-subunit alcohol dehydrogenase family)